MNAHYKNISPNGASVDAPRKIVNGRRKLSFDVASAKSRSES